MPTMQLSELSSQDPSSVTLTMSITLDACPFYSERIVRVFYSQSDKISIG